MAGDRARVPPDLLAAIREHKLELLAHLSQPEATPAAVADALDVCIRLGQQLAQGQIKALRCGISGG